MLSSKRVNMSVVEMYKGKPHIETTITILTPLDEEDELYNNLKNFMSKIEPTMEGMNNDIEDIIGETFESDVVSIYSGVRNL